MAAKKQTSDQLTLNLINEVKIRKAEIAKILAKPSYITNCTFSYNEGTLNGAINIHVENDVRKLVSIGAFLKGQASHYEETAKELGVEEAPKFTWGGFSVDEWLADLKTRLSKVQVAKKQKKLEALEARLNAIISPELRAQMELEAIASELS